VLYLKSLTTCPKAIATYIILMGRPCLRLRLTASPATTRYTYTVSFILYYILHFSPSIYILKHMNSVRRRRRPLESLNLNQLIYDETNVRGGPLSFARFTR
jgi:hypothetical protein